MLDTLWRKQEALGIHLELMGENAYRIHACELHLKGKELQITKKLTDLQSLDTLRQKCPNVNHIALTLTGKGILYKQVDALDEINSQNFSQMLPNAEFQDFYTQNFQQSDKSFVAIMRKSDVAGVLENLNEWRFAPVIISLGPFTLSPVMPQFNFYSGEVIFYKNKIRRSEAGLWESFEYQSDLRSPFPLKISAEPLDEKLVLAYSTAFQWLLSYKVSLVRIEEPRALEALQHVEQSQKLKGYGVLYGLGLFLLLFLNFIGYSHLLSENEELSGKINRNQISLHSYAEVQRQTKEKEALLQDLGWEGGGHKAWYIDQIATVLPDDIRLKGVSVNPMENTTNQKTELFRSREILVSGLSPKILSVNEWISRMKELKWVKNIQLENYVFNQEMNSGQFSLHIYY